MGTRSPESLPESRGGRSARPLVVALVILGALPPALLHWALIGRVPSLDPSEAMELLRRPGGSTVLVDVRQPATHVANPLEGARNWPYEEITAVEGPEAIPADLRSKTLLLLCEGGIRSALATSRLRSLGLENLGLQGAMDVRGGREAWIAAEAHPWRESPLHEQWAAVLSGFIVKSIYTALSLILLIALWRRTSPDLVALRWAMVAFFVGENFCAANYLIFRDSSRLFEYLHSAGMVLCFGFTTYALLEGLDRRIVHLSDPNSKCEAVGLCRRCWKHADAPCALQRMFLYLIPAAMALSLLPICAEPSSVSYNTTILGSPYNYSHPVVYQIFEIRYCPAAAFLLLGASWIVLGMKRREPVRWSKMFFSAGIGALGFSGLRLVLFSAYRQNLVWFGFWEEVTELIFIAGVAVVLWLFRRGLWAEKTA